MITVTIIVGIFTVGAFINYLCALKKQIDEEEIERRQLQREYNQLLVDYQYLLQNKKENR